MYGPIWRTFSRKFKRGRRQCMWCGPLKNVTNNLACHHVGAVHYNPDLMYDERIIMIVCRSCHLMLEPWSRQYLRFCLPQLYEKPIQIYQQVLGTKRPEQKWKKLYKPERVARQVYNKDPIARKLQSKQCQKQ